MLLLTKKKLIVQAEQTMDFFPSVTYYCFTVFTEGMENFLEMKRSKKEKWLLLDLVDYLPEQGPNVTFNLECVLQPPRFFLFCYCSVKSQNVLTI
jgi:hypothetical protein